MSLHVSYYCKPVLLGYIMKKTLTSLFSIIPLTVFSSHIQTQESLQDIPQTKVIYQVPERTPQEKKLEENLRKSILEASRTSPLKNRIGALRLLCLMDLYESMVGRLRSSQKYPVGNQGNFHKLHIDIKEVASKINLLKRDPLFASNYASGDLNQVYDSPPLSRALNKKVIESMGTFFYRCPRSGQLEMDTRALPEDFFPLKIFFLKDKEERAIIISTSFVVKMPEDVNQSQSKLASLKQVVRLPTGYYLPKSTYWQAVQDEGGKWYAQEVEWENLLSDNLLQSESYEQEAWDYTLQVQSPSFVVEDKDSRNWFPFTVYYGGNLPCGATGIDIMITNKHGKAFYQNHCFDSNAHQLKYTLMPSDFYSPEEFYNFGNLDEETLQKVETPENYHEDDLDFLLEKFNKGLLF